MSAHGRSMELGLGEAGLDSGGGGGCGGCGGGGSGGGCGGACGGGGGCGGGGCSGCSTCGGVSERPRWFAGQLVGPSDLEGLQQWVVGRARRHNRMLHGWGVSCGLTVRETTSVVTGEAEPWSLTVGAGYALSACGDEVCVPDPVRIDIRQPRPEGDDACAPPVDPWCAPVRVRRDPQRIYYLAIRYAEEHRRPVRSGGCGCGCDDDPCEYSRVGETYALAVLDALPDCYQEDLREEPDRVVSHARAGSSASAPPSSSLEARREAVGCSDRIRRLGTRPCPDCCSPWIVLADLTVDTKGTVTVDPLSHRRFLASFGSYGFSCTPRPDHRPTVNILQPESGATLPFAHDKPVELQATATDPEDGVLSGGSVQWFDSHHGTQHEPLGAGTSLTTLLSWDDEDKPTAHTPHTILVEAADSDGNVATDSITVMVGDPVPPPPPPWITVHTPANGAVLPIEWHADRRIEVSFDRALDEAQLRVPDPWLRAWEIFPEHEIFNRQFTSIFRLDTTLVASSGGTKATYTLGRAADRAFLYLVQIRGGLAITGAARPPQALDCDFAGSKLSSAVLDEVWSLPSGTEAKRPKGWFDWNAWSPTQAALPSGDGNEGGIFHLLFYVQAPIN